MAGSVASETIFFIGAVVVATGLVAALSGAVAGFSGGLRDHGDSLSKSLATDLVIINDPQNVATSPLVVYAKNTGSVVLTTSLTDVFLDGTPSGSMTYDVLGSTDEPSWRNGEVLKITVNDLAVSSGDHRVRVVAETGVGAELEFRKP